MSETTPSNLSPEEIQTIANEQELRGLVSNLFVDTPLHNDVCHRKATSVAKKLVENVDLSKYAVSFTHFNGHSVVALTDLTSHNKLYINTGFQPPDIPDDFYFVPDGQVNHRFKDPKVEQIESIPLATSRDIESAEAWGLLDAKANEDYYHPLPDTQDTPQQ